MTDKEKLEAIRAEIHRLVHVNGYSKEMANELFSYMNSLPNEPLNEDLEEAWRAAYDKEKDEILVVYDHHAGFVAGANWQQEHTLNKACEWLKANIYKRLYVYDGEAGFPTAEFLKDFRKAMEG